MPVGCGSRCTRKEYRSSCIGSEQAHSDFPTTGQLPKQARRQSFFSFQRTSLSDRGPSKTGVLRLRFRLYRPEISHSNPSTTGKSAQLTFFLKDEGWRLCWKIQQSLRPFGECSENETRRCTVTWLILLSTSRAKRTQSPRKSSSPRDCWLHRIDLNRMKIQPVENNSKETCSTSTISVKFSRNGTR
jgi:hypothetical protein